MNDVRIPVTVGGVTFKNPFYVASGPTTKKVSQLQRIEETGWAAASIKLSIDPAPYINRKPRYALFKDRDALAFTAEKRLTFEQGLKLIEDGKKVLSDLLLMANITYAGDAGVEGWVNMAKRFEEVGADVIELNMCCPNMSYNVSITSGGSECAAKQTGASLGQHGDIVAEIVRAIKSEVKIPLFVKLTPEGGAIATVSKAVLDAGADAVGGTGNRLGMPIIDINEPAKAYYHLQDEISMSCYSSGWLKPLAQRDVYEIRKVCGNEPVVTATGGVRNWRDAAEMVLCGASLIGVCAETLISGYDIARPMISGLKDYMDDKGYKQLSDFRGCIVPEVKTAPEVTLYSGYASIKQPNLYAPCKSACPLHVPVQGYVQAVAKGDYARAYELIASKGPLQNICALLCEHPCEKACVRGRADRPVEIREIKRFVLDYARRNGLKSGIEKKNNGKKAAVVGSGAAGLSAAFELRKNGFAVDVFDRETAFGGSLRFTAPRFMLSDEDVDGVIEELKALGVSFIGSKTLGSDLTLETLKKDYAAVVVAIGESPDKKTDIENVFDAQSFSSSVIAGNAPKGARAVVVCRDGYGADAARTALRLGYEVIAVTDKGERESAFLSEALREGARAIYSVKTGETVSKNGAVAGIEIISEAASDAVTTLACDTLVLEFTGRVNETAAKGLELENGHIKTDESCATSIAGVFAAGDCARDVDFIGCAAMGMKAAASAAGFMCGGKSDESFSTVKAENVLRRNGYIAPTGRPVDNELSKPKDRKSFEKYTRVYTEAEAVEQAGRCLNCGCGEGCQLCKTICTDFAPYIDGCDKLAINSAECVACGMCFNRCPNGNIEMINTGEKV